MIEFIIDFETCILYIHNGEIEDRNFWKGERLAYQRIEYSSNVSYCDIVLKNGDILYTVDKGWFKTL